MTATPAPPPTTPQPGPGPLAGYRRFPNEDGRNRRQAALEVPAMVRSLGLGRSLRVLEIGCGRGIALPALERWCRPVRLVGLDPDRALLAEARAHTSARACRAELVEGDVRRIPFPAAAFDLVVDFGTCYHIDHPDRALREIARVLRPGGLFVHETRLSQLLAHPVRSWGRRIPWERAPSLQRHRTAGLWSARLRTARP